MTRKEQPRAGPLLYRFRDSSERFGSPQHFFHFLLGYCLPALADAAVHAPEAELRERFSLTCRPLEPHLCHDPSAPSPRHRDSPRTRKRLLRANRCFTVAREALGPQHRVVAQWQAALGRLRREHPRFAWLPDYRDPEKELAVD